MKQDNEEGCVRTHRLLGGQEKDGWSTGKEDWLSCRTLRNRRYRRRQNGTAIATTPSIGNPAKRHKNT